MKRWQDEAGRWRIVAIVTGTWALPDLLALLPGIA
jgi:hypothetical protein